MRALTAELERLKLQQSSSGVEVVATPEGTALHGLLLLTQLALSLSTGLRLSRRVHSRRSGLRGRVAVKERAVNSRASG